MDGLFHYVMKSKIKTPFGAQSSKVTWQTVMMSEHNQTGEKKTLCELFELNVQTLTLLTRRVHEATRRDETHQLSIISLMTPMIYDSITLRRISSWSCHRAAFHLIFNKFMRFSLNIVYGIVFTR